MFAEINDKKIYYEIFGDGPLTGVNSHRPILFLIHGGPGIDHSGFSVALSNIVNVTELPIIADADTGFGNAVNAARTVKIFERIGVARLHLEDQTFPNVVDT